MLKHELSGGIRACIRSPSGISVEGLLHKSGIIASLSRFIGKSCAKALRQPQRICKSDRDTVDWSLRDSAPLQQTALGDASSPVTKNP